MTIKKGRIKKTFIEFLRFSISQFTQSWTILSFKTLDFGISLNCETSERTVAIERKKNAFIIIYLKKWSIILKINGGYIKLTLQVFSLLAMHCY